MKITSNYVKKIFWRIFKHDDTVCGLGINEGTIEPGHSATPDMKNYNLVKLEIKEGGLLGKILSPASSGYLFTDLANIEVVNNGTLKNISGAIHENWQKVVVLYLASDTELYRMYVANFKQSGIISWRRYSALPPFYTFGDHDMSKPFEAIMTQPFTEIWFNMSSPISFNWTPSLEAQDIPPYEPLP
ncbi:MAG: hypothetical protein ABI315_05685 [Bacteroidia bacterium]